MKTMYGNFQNFNSNTILQYQVIRKCSREEMCFHDMLYAREDYSRFLVLEI